MSVVINTKNAENLLMSLDILAIIIATTVQALVSVIGLSLLGWKLSQTLREIHMEVTQITATVTFNVLQGRRIEEVLRDARVASPIMAVIRQPAAIRRPPRSCRERWPHLFD